MAQQATFSSYKNRNAIKIVVGSSPGGLSSVVSSAYGESVNERQVVECLGIDYVCDARDSIMADEGFNQCCIVFEIQLVCILYFK